MGEQKTITTGILADDTGKIAFTAWADLDLAENQVVRVDPGYIKAYRGVPQFNFDDAATIETLSDDAVPAADDLAIRTAMDVLNEHPEVLRDPARQVLVLGMGESSIDLSVRGWVNTPDFLRVWAELNHKVKFALENAGLSIPFPQRDVHIMAPGNGNGQAALGSTRTA